MLFNDTISNE